MVAASTTTTIMKKKRKNQNKGCGQYGRGNSGQYEKDKDEDEKKERKGEVASMTEETGQSLVKDKGEKSESEIIGGLYDRRTVQTIE